MVLGIDATQANREIRSGTEWYAFYLIQEFKKLLAGRADLTVRLYTRGPLREDLAAGLPENFEVHTLRWPLPYFWAQGRLSLEMLLHPPDILLCPAHSIPLIHPPKTFTTLHDIGFEDSPQLYDKLSLWYHKFSARLAVRKAFHIFTISHFSKERIVETYHCPEAKLSVIHLGIDHEGWIRKIRNCEKIGIGKILEKYGLRPKSYLLYIGRLEPKKNILNIIRGFAQARTDKQLVLAGRKIRTADVDEYLRQNPDLAGRVQFLGYFDEQDKSALYQGAAIFLFPTLYEGFGLPILEAQASGTPVITSRTASNPEVAGGGALLVDPKSPPQISRAIETILGNAELRDKIIREGFRNTARFRWEETANKTLAIIFEARGSDITGL